MLHVTRRTGVCAVMLFICSCGTVSIKSSPPEADVLVLLPGKETPQSLGKTPFNADLSQLEKAVNDGTIVLLLQKPGYITQQFIVPNLAGGKLDIDTNLLPTLPSNFREVNKIVSLTLKAERHLLQKQFDEALKTSAEIKKLNENVASAFEIEATVHFLENRLEKSRYAWIRTLELDPDNPEAQAMLATVEKRMNVTGSIAAPASGGDKK